VTTAAQIRAARHLVSLSQADIVSATGLSLPTVKRAESERAVSVSPEAIAGIRRALEADGVEFVDGDEPGVKLWRVTAKCPKCGFEARVAASLTEPSGSLGEKCQGASKRSSCRFLRKAVSAAHQALRLAKARA
jgi:transcriptional regulator with XRE-family HTH domain